MSTAETFSVSPPGRAGEPWSQAAPAWTGAPTPPPAVLPPAAAPEEVTVRVLDAPAEVDLLPLEVRVEDRVARARRLALVLVAVVLLLLAGASFAARGAAERAGQELARQQTREARLSAVESQQSALPRVEAEIGSVTAARSAAMAEDVLWYRYLADLSQRMPAGTTVQSLLITTARTSSLPATATDAGTAPDPATSTTSTTAAGAGSTTEVTADGESTTTGVGTLTLTATGTSQPATAELIDVLTATPGLVDVWVDSSTRAEPGDGYTVVAHAQADAGAVSHRYDDGKS